MLAIDPDNDIAQNNLSFDLSIRGQYAEAESLAMGCVNRGQLSNCPFHAIRNQLLQNKLPAAESTLARWEKGLPQDPNMRQVSSGVAGWKGDYALADERARELEKSQAGSEFWRAQAAHLLGASAFTQGKIAEGERQFRASAALNESRGAPDQYLCEMALLAQTSMRYRERPADAIAILTEALARHPLSTIDPSDRPYSRLAISYALAGQPDEAQRLMTEYARVVPEGVLKGEADRFAAAGEIAMARGKFAEALSRFQESKMENPCQNCGFFEAAQARTKLGQADSARVNDERFLGLGGAFRLYGDAKYRAAAFQRLGEIYEAKGDRKRAVEYYEKLIGLWKNADAELQPIVRDAKARVARLSGEH